MAAFSCKVKDYKNNVNQTLHLEFLQCDANTNPEIADEELEQFCKEHGFVDWIKTSAKDGYNVAEAFDIIVKIVSG